MGETVQIAMIGFGEAAIAFAGALGAACPSIRAFDVATDEASTRERKLADYKLSGVAGCATAEEAIASATLILSLVTADQALAAARSAARHIQPGAFFCDMNSVGPETKRQAAALIEQAGGRYVDVAVMAPVHPAGTGVPLLVSGASAEPAADMLRGSGFADVSIAGPSVGAASAIKMIRSVMVKGMEALSAECFLAAERAGVSTEVIASLDASWPGADWARRADYNLDRMLVHGKRRAAEMEQVAETLAGLGSRGGMTREAIAWQRTVGEIGRGSPQGLAAKVRLIMAEKAEVAA